MATDAATGSKRAVGIAAIVVVVGLAGGFVAWWSVGRSDPLAGGRSAYARGDWGGALKAARARLEDDRKDRPAMRLAARAAARLGRDDVARGYYRRLGDEGTEAEDESLLAGLLLRQGNEDRAMGVLRQALGRDPNHAESLWQLARLEMPRHLYDAARPRAATLAATPGWEARGSWALARMAFDSFEPAAAADHLSRALRLDPEGRTLPARAAAVRKLRARALLRAGRPAEAREELEVVLHPGPDGEASWLLSRAFLQLGDASRTTAALALAGDYAVDPMAHEPAPYVGSARFAECHGPIHAAQQASPHARTFARAEALGPSPLPDRPVVDSGNPGVTHTFARDGDRIRVEAKVGDKAYPGLVEYAMGSGRHAMTFVVRDPEGLAREHRLTRYAGGVGWDVTPLHDPRPADESRYLGAPHPEDSVHNCLNCHFTDFRAARDRTGPEAADRGIGCERCHGPGGHHVAAVAAKLDDPAIARPLIASNTARTALCAQCHQAPVGHSPDDRDFPRFQWPALGLSRCFDGSSGALDCVTCHDPHRDSRPSTADYEAKCLACHGQAEPSKRIASASFPRTTCPVDAKQGCLGCHMPPLPEVLPHIAFTDHRIRVRRGEGSR